ncbi:hypothetical protein [Xylanibacter rodentium]|uniref:hypothetical protein n=1 Tax=Xylanibacter rodentium TaxID=2736289 RepID=UPI00259CBA29|nr:hypothetical protein [Xylanibacter rodentium]
MKIQSIHFIFALVFVPLVLCTVNVRANALSFVTGATGIEKADAAASPAVEITLEKMPAAASPVPINTTTVLCKFKVVATDLPAAAPIYLTGGDAAFSTSHTEIPAGTSTTEVVVSVTPSTLGTHKGGIAFDFDGINPEFNQAYSLNVKAYDPDHLPTITLSRSEVELEARVGSSAEAELTVTPSYCFDYINVKAGEAQNTGLIVSSTLFLPNLGEQKFRITFRPKTEGTVTQTYTFTTTMGEPVVLTVTARATGDIEPEPVEGDELVLDGSAPLAFYEQTFDDVAEHNKPLHIAGWTNVAENGTRAWWGYTSSGDEPFTAAKATLYDSKVAETDGTAASMLLVSPALDYRNAKGKMLEFRLMGQFLHDDQEEKLDVCLVELIDGKPYIYPMQGFGIPAKADESGNWIPYEVDLSVVEDMPDVFFIGFRLSAKRCAASSATYYIDDFKWGREKTADGIISVKGGTCDDNAVYNMQGVRVLDKATPESLHTLVPGIYIYMGQKIRI